MPTRKSPCDHRQAQVRAAGRPESPYFQVGTDERVLTALHTGALGALLPLSFALYYPAYGNAAVRFGLTPLEDQQLGGLIMWIPGGVAYVAAALALAAGWLR